MAKQVLRIALTTGDADGIGTEITAKALAKLGPQPHTFFYLWRSPKCPKSHLSLIDKKFKRITVSTWPEALKVDFNSNKMIVDINSNLAPPFWVETTAQSSFYGHIDAMVTAPLSKTAIAQAGLKDIGHTDILKRICGNNKLFMGFIGTKFHVVLATAHCSVQKIPENLTSEKLLSAIVAADNLRILLPKPVQKKPIALLGLNPHSGEEGLIGFEEQNIHLPVMKRMNEGGFDIVGPLVPDAAFFKENWSKYSVYVANYHDQGLIPFKMIHGQESGLHITMGLPFIRTSVDHGTAKDIFGRNKANFTSMKLAIEWAIKLTQASKRS